MDTYASVKLICRCFQVWFVFLFCRPPIIWSNDDLSAFGILGVTFLLLLWSVIVILYVSLNLENLFTYLFLIYFYQTPILHHNSLFPCPNISLDIKYCFAEHKSWFCYHTAYPKKYAHGFCFAVLCCGYTLTDFPISIRLTSLALWQSNDCPSASRATLMNMDKYFMWIHYERLHNHNKAKNNKTVCIFLGIYCSISKELSEEFAHCFVYCQMMVAFTHIYGDVIKWKHFPRFRPF